MRALHPQPLSAVRKAEAFGEEGEMPLALQVAANLPARLTLRGATSRARSDGRLR
jgi:hypothetical protein